MVAELGLGAIWSILFHNDQVWVGTASHIVRYAPNFAKIDNLQGHTKPITAMINVGNEVWTCSQDCTIRVWNEQGDCTHKLTEHTLQVIVFVSNKQKKTAYLPSFSFRSML